MTTWTPDLTDGCLIATGAIFIISIIVGSIAVTHLASVRDDLRRLQVSMEPTVVIGREIMAEYNASTAAAHVLVDGDMDQTPCDKYCNRSSKVKEALGPALTALWGGAQSDQDMPSALGDCDCKQDPGKPWDTL